jgi:hypothetical protein
LKKEKDAAEAAEAEKTRINKEMEAAINAELLR